MSKRSLQIVPGFLGAIPVLTGLIGMSGVRDPIYASARLAADSLLDSNLRFFSGLWLGLGLALLLAHPKNREADGLVSGYLDHDFSRWRRAAPFHVVSSAATGPIRGLYDP
jgi:hypothetical protein